MGLVKEGLHYLGVGYFNLPDPTDAVHEKMDKGNLYYKWGKESRQKGDFYIALEDYTNINDPDLDFEKDLLHKYERSLDCVLELLRIELKEATNAFDFLCDNKVRIELRDLPFPKKIQNKAEDFLNFEEALQEKSKNIKSTFTELTELSGSGKEKRKNFLEDFEKNKRLIDQGIEAFYKRISEFISS